MAKTSLEKSHSKASNFKLTFICFLTILFFGILWCGIVLLKGDQKTFGLVLTIAGGAGTVLCYLMLNAFSRG
ncbi:MAG: hypothetical protein K6E24_01460 [bacterium]|jgi:hypothetical protein|nr:hypothetical protein [bacterium]